ncbi:Scr1 family TA system antitoxin-like transcriptional regulator [Saccharopolyspora mangrovi]|uniref:Scr1 family TA system antitoxin-like transcriptional regulator n=1 Tax=Saccharopolyspora mangrovi TaxID=3082379 RepID=A0ABU6A962_9PSEU|nr:Scr1 family TA system antitoxin-like transcriptional regulator [Saccharopolyspora sp. S2-29]MEB3368026.1 Scr1 family TA system antitoxin-like transcriptional regulator [Saccharopolyspora sp. S2-29]
MVSTTRQERLFEERPLHLTDSISEAASHRCAKTDGIAEKQFGHLLEMGERFAVRRGVARFVVRNLLDARIPTGNAPARRSSGAGAPFLPFRPLWILSGGGVRIRAAAAWLRCGSHISPLQVNN